MHKDGAREIEKEREGKKTCFYMLLSFCVGLSRSSRSSCFLSALRSSLTACSLVFHPINTQCVKACLDLAPKSDDYCNDTCADECKAMKEDGDEGNTAFSAPEPDEGLQGKINNVLDKGAVFFVR